MNKSTLKYLKTYRLNYLNTSFTMAEILLSLTIIGVVAAITLPILTGNINEKTWKTQKKALYARMSQAIALMPALNGYDTADKFVTEGLTKVLKINNICDNEHLKDCGFTDNLTTLSGEKIAIPTRMRNLNSNLIMDWGGGFIQDTNAAAIETANGESILVFYNTACTGKDVTAIQLDSMGTPGYQLKHHVCVNFIFDLNGKKGPNTVSKDIGVISAVYPSDSFVVMPMLGKKISTPFPQTDAGKACRDVNADFRLPNIEELLAINYNKRLMVPNNVALGGWSSSTIDTDNAWSLSDYDTIKFANSKSKGKYVFCILK